MQDLRQGQVMDKAVLLSVSNRQGLADFARALAGLGYRLLATSGTSKYLAGQGVPALPVEQYTGQKEIMDGRVKTLHPKIYAGLLARRDNPQDMEDLAAAGIMPIDVAAVNLYPFAANMGMGKTDSQMVELIDVGGPSMIRAAAKNFKFVWPIIDPADYQSVLQYLSREQNAMDAGAGLVLRHRLAVKVFSCLANDALEIAAYFAARQPDNQPPEVNLNCGQDLASMAYEGLAEIGGAVCYRKQSLRYGENPHQQAAFYHLVGKVSQNWRQLAGKELSYNNLLDVDAVLRLLGSLPAGRDWAVIVKHLNPCGVASGASQSEALKRAKHCDPRSHFGGIIGFSKPLSADTAQEIRSDFAEVIIAPSFSAEALQTLQSAKNLRVLEVDPAYAAMRSELRSVLGGVLIQESDAAISDVREAELVSGRRLEPRELDDLQLAWAICVHVKSNAIVMVKEEMLLGVGAGQMSRIDAVEVALMKAKFHGHDLHGAVAASDAFFPFADGVETLAGAGIGAVIAPRGAKRDADCVAAAERGGISLLFAADRHFRH